jgi:hypothetical protein
MKISVLPVILLLSSFSCFAQNLIGSWEWKNEKYKGIAEIDSNVIHNLIYFINTDVKVLETYNYYQQEKNKLYLSENKLTSADKKNADTYKIKFNGENSFTLTGTSEDLYEKKSSELPQITRYEPGEINLVNKKLQCTGQNQKEGKARECLSIGNINFFNTYNDVTARLGKPFNTVTNSDNSKTYTFLVYPKDKKTPHLLVTMKDEKIIRLQLKGYKSNDDFSFSSIRLGDYYTFVKHKFGEPYFKKEVKAAGDETWVYSPIPITIEFRLNKVSSITIEPFQLQD